MSTKAEKRHMGRVASLGCYLCRQLGYGETPAQVHHVREGQGMAQRASNWLTVPLCPPCHRGPQGWHGSRQRWTLRKMDMVKAINTAVARAWEAA